MRKSATGLVALVLFIVVGTAHAYTLTGTGKGLTFTATGPGDNRGETLHASATFAVSNLNLIVTLENTGTFDPNDPADILTALFFTIAGNLALTRVSAELGPDSSVIGHRLPLGFDGDVGGEWTYRNNLTRTPQGANEGISSTNLKWFGNKKYLFPGEQLRGAGHPGGVDFGITTLFDLPSNNRGGIKNKGLIQNVVVFTFGLPAGFERMEISDVTFLYGTNLKPSEILDGVLTAIPEPSTISLVTAGLLGALTLARRRMLRR